MCPLQPWGMCPCPHGGSRVTLGVTDEPRPCCHHRGSCQRGGVTLPCPRGQVSVSPCGVAGVPVTQVTLRKHTCVPAGPLGSLPGAAVSPACRCVPWALSLAPGVSLLPGPGSGIPPAPPPFTLSGYFRAPRVFLASRCGAGWGRAVPMSPAGTPDPGGWGRCPQGVLHKWGRVPFAASAPRPRPRAVSQPRTREAGRCHLRPPAWPDTGCGHRGGRW